MYKSSSFKNPQDLNNGSLRDCYIFVLLITPWIYNYDSYIFMITRNLCFWRVMEWSIYSHFHSQAARKRNAS